MIARLGRALAAVALAVWALAAGAAPAPVAVGADPALPLGAGIALLHDESGILDLAAIRHLDERGDFFPPPSLRPALGYREGATWVRFRLENEGDRATERWLELGAPFTQSATLFLVSSQGAIRRLENGSRIPLPQRPLANHRLLFPVALPAGDGVTGYLRIGTRSSTIVDLTLWDPASFADRAALRNAASFFVAGLSLTVVAFSFLAWQARRQAGLLGLGAAQLCMMVVVPALDGMLAGLFPGGDGLGQARLAWGLLYLFFACHAVFATAFLRLPERHPRLARLLTAIAWVSLALACFAPIDTFPGFRAAAAAALATLLIATVAAGCRGFGTAGRLFFGAWVLVWTTIALRLLQHLGLAAWLPFIDETPLLAFGIADVALAYALYLDIRKVRAESDRAQRQLLQLQHSEQERLVAAVGARTAELQEAIQRAETANQAKTAFLSAVSHELRTPLHTILGYTQLLQRQVAGEARDKLDTVANSSGQLLRLIDDILDFSRGEAVSVDLELAPVNLATLIRRLEDDAHLLAARRGNVFTVSRPAGLPPAVETDEQRLAQILQNLIGNACKYTENGRVQLEIRPDAEPTALADGSIWHRLRFTVADNGPGIPVADQARIFDPFSRAGERQRQPGVGLGLAIARQLTHALGGQIAVDSAPGQGSRFHVTLPLRAVAEELPASPPAGTPGPLPPARPRTVLVADDIADNRAILREMLGRQGFSVLTAENGEEALARCLAADPPVAAALVDQFMPQRDGWGFLLAIRSAPDLRQMPVILISAAPPKRPADFPEGMDFDHKLMKPLRLDQLAELLEAIPGLEGGSPRAEPLPPAPAPWRFPPPERLPEFRELLALGKVVALQGWARQVAAEHPESVPCCERVGQLARAVDLPGLKRLREEWEAAAG